MKPGDLVRVIVDDLEHMGIVKDDFAILMDIDWDHHDYPDGIVMPNGMRITGRGFFYFPAKPELTRHGRLSVNGCLGVLLVYENFEVIA